MHDIFRETPMYQEALHEGDQLGRLEIQRDNVTNIVQARFPSLELLAKQRVALSNNIQRLSEAVVQMSLARNEQEAERHLLSITSDA